jgi:DEP domain-containing protein 5
MWIYNRIEGPVNPIEILETMRSKGLICHASGDLTQPIISGFSLYYIVNQDVTSTDYRKALGDLEAFENEWMEVEIPKKFITSNHPIVQTASEALQNESEVPSFLKEHVEKKNLDGKLYKQSHLEIDLNSKSDRVEWGHARYHRQMIPGNAFELTAQWLTASGPIVYDLIYGWSRKAQACGFQLVSIPADPLAEPFVERSDPLRSPIFVPLNIECLMQNRAHLFEDFKKETWADRMLLFQDEIVRRFGFISCACETKTGSNMICVDWQYVHVTGNMFILVPSSCHGARATMRRIGMTNGNNVSPIAGSLGTQKRLKNYYTTQQSSVPQKENYISRHVNGSANSKEGGENGFNNGPYYGNDSKLGFLWQWNHMIANKKWKSFVINGTDEIFQLRLLRDFKDFCSNADGRLLKFWDEAWEKKEKLSLATTV